MQIVEGAIVIGKVTGLTDFGAFVELEGGKTGLIHISEVSSDYITDIKEHLKVGQKVQTKVISVSEDGKISLSIRKLEGKSSTKQKEEGSRKQETPKKNSAPRKNTPPNVWQGQKTSAPTSEKQSFEDMMAKFKKVSDEKMSDLKRTDAKRGSVGYSRKGKN